LSENCCDEIFLFFLKKKKEFMSNVTYSIPIPLSSHQAHNVSVHQPLLKNEKNSRADQPSGKKVEYLEYSTSIYTD
jgi:hypothetical protein